MFYSIEFGKHNLEDVTLSAAPGDFIAYKNAKKEINQKIKINRIKNNCTFCHAVVI
jgi:hypothetical protein